MGIPAQVLDGVAEAIEGLLDEGAPVPSVKAVPEGLPAGRFPESGTGAREGKGAILIEPVQEGKVFPPELVPQDKNRQEEFPTAPADPAVRGKAAAGKDAVHMDMAAHLLVPGMEHLDDAVLGAQVFFVGAQFQERLRAASVEEPVKDLLVGKDEGVQLMGEGKDHMEVRRVNDLGPAPVHPELLLDGLAVGAAAVVAGIIMGLHVAAVGAEAPVTAQLPGLAAHDGMCRLTLDIGLRGAGRRESRVSGKEDLLYLEGAEKPLHFFVMHGYHPRSGRRGSPWYRRKQPPGAHRWRWN